MSASARLVAVGEIAAMLAGQVHSLARELLPNGRRIGHEWCTGSNRAQDNFKVHLSGGKAGVWADFTTGECGDALDLVAHVRYGGDKRQAIVWARQWLGLDSPDPAVLASVREHAQKASEARADEAAADAEAARNAAFRMWLSARASIVGTPADVYLRGRGISIAELGRQPGALRFHPGLYHPGSGRTWPGLVTAIGDMAGRHIATHRTFLEVLDDGRVRKAPVEPNKMVLGAYRGGCIRLWRGASNKRLADAGEGETVDITEGIEDGLSVALAMPECRVLAAVSLSNMAALKLPDAVRAVRIWHQRDDTNAALAAADRAIQAHIAAGRQVLLPPIPPGFKDVNDMLRGEHGR